MKIRTGDKVMVITGKDRGKTGTVTRAFPRENLLLIEGVNLKKKHERPRGRRKGQVVERPMPIHASNAMLLDPKTGKPTRALLRRADGRHARIAKRSGNEI